MKTLTRPSAGPRAVVIEELDYALAHGQITADQRTEILNDEVLMREYELKFTEDIITGFVRIGGKITPSTEAYIKAQGWGEGWIENGLMQNKNVQRVEADLKEKGILGAEGLRGFMKTKKGKSILAILTGIVAGLITTPIGGAAIGAAIGAGAGAGGGHAYSKGVI